MTYLFSPEGLRRLREAVTPQSLFAFDLDGTLAPIAAHPSLIRISDEINAQLIHLNRIAVLAIITGRSRADALSHLGFVPAFIAGNHGAEGLPGEEAREQEFRDQSAAWERTLSEILPPEEISGIFLENKGTSLSLHFRNAPDTDMAHRIIERAIERLVPGPYRIGGKMIENILPPNSPNKGDALRAIMNYARMDRALFVGDDLTDEDAFRLANDSILCIRVGKKPDSAAPFFVESQAEMLDLLQKVTGILES